MGDTRIVRVRESILKQSRVEADALKLRLSNAGVAFVNVIVHVSLGALTPPHRGD